MKNVFRIPDEKVQTLLGTSSANMDSGKYTWNVDQETLALMKGAKPGDEFASPTFNFAGLTWKLVSYPNGNSDGRAGTFDVFLTLVTMPESWKNIFLFRRIQCDQTKGSFAYYCTYKKGTSKGWMKTMIFTEIQSLNKLSFTVEVMISRIVLKDEETIFYQKPIKIKAQQIRWKMDKELWRCVQNAHIGKYFASEIFGNMWCIGMNRQSTSFRIYLTLCAMPRDLQSVKAMASVECIFKGKGINKKITKSGNYTWDMNDDGSIPGKCMISEKNKLPMDLIKQCYSMEIKVGIIPDPDRTANEHWRRLTARTDTDQKEKENEIEIEVEVDPENMNSNQRDKRLDLIEARVDSLVSSIDQLTSQVTQNNKQSAALRDQLSKSVESKFDQMEQRIMSIDSKLREVQQRTDSNLRRNSESNQSQSVEILAQMAKMREEIIALKEAQGNQGGDEEVKEETEEEKLRKWMENEVKLPRYFHVLKENGFEDMESVQYLTENELKEMGIDKMGHRKKIMRHIAELQSANNPIVPVKVSVPRQQVPAAAYSFGAAPAQNAKVDVEGANVVDTGH